MIGDRLPRIMIPSHLTKQSKKSDHGFALELLNDATKAYVFGMPAAAVAMCRAVCELVLKKFYVSASEDDREQMLNDLIWLAEKKYHHIQELNIREHVRTANAVMHDYTNAKRLSEDEDEAVVQFLETVKALIEKAPVPH